MVYSYWGVFLGLVLFVGIVLLLCIVLCFCVVVVEFGRWCGIVGICMVCCGRFMMCLGMFCRSCGCMGW